MPCPGELQRVLEQEMAHGTLGDWQQMKDFLINYSDSTAVSRRAKTGPIPAKHVADKHDGDSDADYTDEQWHVFQAHIDGHAFALSNPTHPQVQSYVLSIVVKGAAKGKAKDNGHGIDGKGKASR